MTSGYDFIIIGGGTAGLVMANRLSEDPSQRILVLEAGADLSEDPRVKTPALYMSLIGSQADWNFQTKPQPELNGRTINLNQGKGLGGSSAINAHAFVPPSTGTIDAWEALGNDGWNWSTLQPYFARAVTFPVINDHATRQALGIDGLDVQGEVPSPKGPLQLSFAGDPEHPIRKAWAETFKRQGYLATKDPFLGISSGAFSCLASIHPGKKERNDAASAYYHPIKDRTNLVVLTNAVVQKIVFEASTAGSASIKATGVQYVRNDKTETAICSKEVILAAGALQSPKVLELSGVGDAALLAAHGIKPVLDLPGVGENLQDHLICGIGCKTVDGIETLDPLVRQEPEALGKAMQDYATSKTGLLTSIGLHTYAYLPVPSAAGQETIKQLLSQHRPPPLNSNSPSPEEARARAYYDIAERTLLSHHGHLDAEPSAAYLSVLCQQVLPAAPGSRSPTGPIPGSFLTLGVMPSQPLSRGSVHIASGDPGAAPAVDPAYLSHPVDAELFAQHLQHLEAIATAAPLRDLLRQPLVRRDPASGGWAGTEAKAEAEQYARASAIPMWHLGGTCAMLPRDRGGVVSPELRVYGAENLRVVDASAVPLISTANLQATVYALAERAADLVKRQTTAHGLQ
ncbi:hypothetical protein SLS62_004542 [Diatrype stigma]|uniref:Glucose-methanol-choline oxidoreductase N-terminal domain-containing protein n=1 Tax=Diatrype stigma TaxID=117547 RepID=A0AAN9YT02_9PEZI